MPLLFDDPSKASIGCPAQILIADDDPGIRDLLRDMVEGLGYEAISLPNGAAALAAGEPPDVVLLDLQMPGMDGYKVCQVLRRGVRTRQIPVVMMTASDDPHLNREAYAAGAQACVPKPFRKEGLIAAIQAAVSGMSREKPPTSQPPVQ